MNHAQMIQKACGWMRKGPKLAVPAGFRRKEVKMLRQRLEMGSDATAVQKPSAIYVKRGNQDDA